MPRLLVHSDAVASGGAEEVLRVLLGGLSPQWEVVVVGVSEEVSARIASARPGTRWLTVRVGPRWDLGSILRLRHAFAQVDPDVVHVNLTWTGGNRGGGVLPIPLGGGDRHHGP